jgi:hypothetical protein
MQPRKAASLSSASFLCLFPAQQISFEFRKLRLRFPEKLTPQELGELQRKPKMQIMNGILSAAGHRPQSPRKPSHPDEPLSQRLETTSQRDAEGRPCPATTQTSKWEHEQALADESAPRIYSAKGNHKHRGQAPRVQKHRSIQAKREETQNKTHKRQGSLKVNPPVRPTPVA